MHYEYRKYSVSLSLFIEIRLRMHLSCFIQCSSSGLTITSWQLYNTARAEISAVAIGTSTEQSILI
jgi:hypothetical protein